MPDPTPDLAKLLAAAEAHCRSTYRVITSDFIALIQRCQRAEAALQPGESPCDCTQEIAFGGTQSYTAHCVCGNDECWASAMAWCDRKNRYDTYRAALAQARGES